MIWVRERIYALDKKSKTLEDPGIEYLIELLFEQGTIPPYVLVIDIYYEKERINRQFVEVPIPPLSLN